MPPDALDDTLVGYCPYCGAPIAGDFKFCRRCGRRMPALQPPGDGKPANPSAGPIPPARLPGPVDSKTRNEKGSSTKERLTCSECGAEVNENHRFCPMCGEAFTE